MPTIGNNWYLAHLLNVNLNVKTRHFCSCKLIQLSQERLKQAGCVPMGQGVLCLAAHEQEDVRPLDCLGKTVFVSTGNDGWLMTS